MCERAHLIGIGIKISHKLKGKQRMVWRIKSDRESAATEEEEEEAATNASA